MQFRSFVLALLLADAVVVAELVSSGEEHHHSKHHKHHKHHGRHHKGSKNGGAHRMSRREQREAEDKWMLLQFSDNFCGGKFVALELTMDTMTRINLPQGRSPSILCNKIEQNDTDSSYVVHSCGGTEAAGCPDHCSGCREDLVKHFKTDTCQDGYMLSQGPAPLDCTTDHTMCTSVNQVDIGLARWCDRWPGGPSALSVNSTVRHHGKHHGKHHKKHHGGQPNTSTDVQVAVANATAQEQKNTTQVSALAVVAVEEHHTAHHGKHHGKHHKKHQGGQQNTSTDVHVAVANATVQEQKNTTQVSALAVVAVEEHHSAHHGKHHGKHHKKHHGGQQNMTTDVQVAVANATVQEQENTTQVSALAVKNQNSSGLSAPITNVTADQQSNSSAVSASPSSDNATAHHHSKHHHHGKHHKHHQH